MSFDNLQLPSNDPKSNAKSEKKDTSINTDDIHINSISPNINLVSKPLVMIVGPSGSGKTTIIMRILRYLSKDKVIKYDINNNFVNIDYHKFAVTQFKNSLVNKDLAPSSTASLNFLLIDLYKNTEVQAHILEAPGEHYYNPDNPDGQFPIYLNTILSNTNIRKIYAFVFEPNMFKQMKQDQNIHKTNYANRISKIARNVRKDDAVIILFSKVDEADNLIASGKVNQKALRNLLVNDGNYNDFFSAISSNKNIEETYWVGFSTGTYGLDPITGKVHVAESSDLYPRDLWKTLYAILFPSWLDKIFKKWK